MARLGRPARLILGLSALAAALLILRYAAYPSAADSWSYLFYAFRFRMHGPLHDFGTIRTYGYPLLLLPLTWLAGYEHARLSAIAGGVQYALYAVACLWLSAGLRAVSPRWALAALGGLLLGPLGLALVTDTLTEAPSLILAVLLAALAVRLGTYTPGRTEALVVAGGALAGFALMVRPANLPLLLGWHAGILAALLLAPHWAGHRRRLVLAALGGALLGAASWLPQALYALRAAGEASVLPLCRLGGFQATFGALVWKYDTLMTGGGAGPWYTPNPLFSGHLEAGEGWGWYLGNPLRGAATMLAHLLLSFDVPSPFVYLHDRQPWYRHATRALYWAATVIAAIRLAQLAGRPGRTGAIRAQPVAILFLGLSCAAIMGINTIAAVETRFNAVPLALATVIAAEALLAARAGTLGWGRVRWMGAAAAVLLLVGAALGVEATGAASLPPGTSFTLPARLRCVLTFESEAKGDATVMREHEEALARRRRAP